MLRYVAVILAVVALLAFAASADAQGGCLTRDEAIVVIAHKVDVEHGGRLDKALVWQIAERESGLSHCDKRGRVKVRASELAVLIWNGNPDLAAPQREWKSTSNFVRSAEDFSDVERQEEDSH
jgi:phosphate-selective porin